MIMARRILFSGGPKMIFQVVTKHIFPRGTKSGEILFCPLESKRTTLFAIHIIGKCQISKFRWVMAPSAPTFGRQCLWCMHFKPISHACVCQFVAIAISYKATCHSAWTLKSWAFAFWKPFLA